LATTVALTVPGTPHVTEPSAVIQSARLISVFCVTRNLLFTTLIAAHLKA